jgi:hypothetical protein
MDIWTAVGMLLVLIAVAVTVTPGIQNTWSAWITWAVTVGFGIFLVWHHGVKTSRQRRAAALQQREADEIRELVRMELARLTEAERAALCLVSFTPMNEQTLHERLANRGFQWSSTIPTNLQRQLVSHDFNGVFYVLAAYQTAVRELCPAQNTGILTINTGAFRH